MITAYTFTATDLRSGRSIARAVFCPDVAYAALQTDAGEIQRLYAHLTTLKAIKAQIALGLEPGPIAHDSPLAQFLIGRRSDWVLQYVSVEPVEIRSPGDAVTQLDARLRQLQPA